MFGSRNTHTLRIAPSMFPQKEHVSNIEHQPSSHLYQPPTSISSPPPSFPLFSQDPTKALDGLSPATNVVNPYSDSKLQELGMTRVGRSIVKATTPLFFTADQLAQNQ